jgi:two-component system response regulator MprA
MARVLVVDDEPAVRRALERALHLEQHEVTLASDGEEALDLLATQPADAVILDVMMPRLDGLEVCRRLRKAGDRTPVLMLTARDAIDDRVEGLDVGADDYLVKPFAPFLRRRRRRREADLRRPRARSDRPRGPSR